MATTVLADNAAAVAAGWVRTQWATMSPSPTVLHALLEVPHG